MMGVKEEMPLLDPDDAIGSDDDFVNQTVSELSNQYHVDGERVELNQGEYVYLPHQYLQFVKPYSLRAALCYCHHLAQKLALHYFEEYSIELKHHYLLCIQTLLPLIEK